MNKLRTYYIPIELKMTNTLVVKAISEEEAVKIVNESITRNEDKLAINYNTVKVIRDGIYCEETAEIYDEYVKDFGLTDRTVLKSNCDGDLFMTKEATMEMCGDSKDA